MIRRSRHRQHRQGASAVEFAMVAAPFFFMLFAILELGMVFVTDSVLENAMMETGRLVRTGRADVETIDEAEFKEELCGRMSVFAADCADRANIDVREIPQFRDPTLPDPLEDGETFDESKLDYDIGDPGSLMLVRVWYEQPLITPFLSKSLSELDDRTMLMTVTTAFRNEPYR